MWKACIVDISKAEAVAWSGLCAGGLLYINMVQTPALKSIKDTNAVREYWKYSLERGCRLLPAMAVLSAGAAGVVYYLGESEKRNLWLAGAITMLSNFPFTKCFMVSDMRELFDDEVISKKGDSWVRNTIKSLDRKFMVKTLLAVTSCGIFLFASRS